MALRFTLNMRDVVGIVHVGRHWDLDPGQAQIQRGASTNGSWGVLADLTSSSTSAVFNRWTGNFYCVRNTFFTVKAVLFTVILCTCMLGSEAR